jgi:hypothetical protein
MTRILFLDFDGVLNSRGFLAMSRGLAISRYPHSEIDPEAVARVNRILERTEAEVVVSSSWRHGRTLAELQALLESHGLCPERGSEC